MAVMPTSIRLSDEERWLLDQLAQRMGERASGVLSRLIREEAIRRDITAPTPEQLAHWRQDQKRRKTSDAGSGD